MAGEDQIILCSAQVFDPGRIKPETVLLPPTHGKYITNAMSANLSQHLIDPYQTSIHDLFPGADCYRRHSAIRAVTALRHRFDCREILMVPVAITEEEKLLHPSTFLQADRVIAEELARGAYQCDVAVE